MNEKRLAMINDERLFQMAVYHETEGLLKQTDNMNVIADRFADFKQLIQKGSFTVDQLEERTYSRYGIVDDLSLQRMEVDDKVRNNFKNIMSKNLNIKDQEEQKENQ